MTVTVGNNTQNIDGAVLPSDAAALRLPKLSEGALAGLAKRKVSLSVRVAPGTGGSADLAVVKVKLPAGLSWNAKALGKDLSLGAAKFTRTVSKGTLTLTLAAGQRAFKLTVRAGGLSDTKKLGLEAKRRLLASETVAVSVTDSQGLSTALSFKVKRPH